MCLRDFFVNLKKPEKEIAVRKIKLIIISSFIVLLAGCSPKTLTFGETLTTELQFAEELQEYLDTSRQLTDLTGVSAAVIVDGKGMWSGNSGESAVTLSPKILGHTQINFPIDPMGGM